MAARGDSEGFVSTPLEDKGARPKDAYFPLMLICGSIRSARNYGGR